MMKYKTKRGARNEYVNNSDHDAEKYLARNILEPIEEFTGLYDGSGRKIYKVMDRIGFMRGENDE